MWRNESRNGGYVHRIKNESTVCVLIAEQITWNSRIKGENGYIDRATRMLKVLGRRERENSIAKRKKWKAERQEKDSERET